MNIVLYARVSTDDKEQDPERQLLKLRQYAELHNHSIICELVDVCTGDSDPFSRPHGSHLLDFSPDGILFYSMDRFTRQHPTKVIQLINRMKDQGVKLVSITEPAFNMESEFSEIMLFIMTWFNNYFLIKLKRDIRSGMDRARLKGKHIGRARSTFNKQLGYQLLFEQRVSQREAARLLHTSLATVNRFKRMVEKNGVSYILEQGVSMGDGSGTSNEVKI